MEQIIYFKTFLCLPNTLVGGKVCLHTFTPSQETSCKFCLPSWKSLFACFFR